MLKAISEATVAYNACTECAKPAVAMLREEYDWHVHVAMDPDEVWGDDGDDGDIGDMGSLGTGEGKASVAPRGLESPASANTSEEEEELENVIRPGIPEGSNFVKFDNDPCRHRTDFSWLYVRNNLADPGYDYDKTVSITVEKSQPKSMKRWGWKHTRNSGRTWRGSSDSTLPNCLAPPDYDLDDMDGMAAIQKVIKEAKQK